MSSLQKTFPLAPDAVWKVLPAGVAAVPGKGMIYDAQRNLLTFQNATAHASWGQEITVHLHPNAQGTTLTVTTKLRGGVFDWGQGKRCAGRFVAAVTDALGMYQP